MAQVGGMLTAAVLKIVAEQIGSIIGGEIKRLCNLNDDLEDMRMTLESVLALLKDAERQSVKSVAVLLWLKRLKFAAYDISDMIDEFEADAMTKAVAPKVLLSGRCS
ncbi:Os11g0212100 [Oryza sativa Japonica Group]|uniref:NBS-LRR disease resistance protein, putative n=2 Tax=Oryza sativa subsp. japonica TaxID=39947 RepID=Q2R8Y1_ORYSJ|nr:NBS-LRR disease resistance protein, putative [Oryza sativa Japonica Group]EAZ17801.1 hypothetical protein OsJ_33342 [Oryza sativa Japonica Group]KAB8114658.1 hypothetical protein EE612_054189 [Oryza sativa]KAF2910071.1 hypothetical protein DAI22_11g072400 [Oryza sativa Japonica Group]BAT13189.1 Os11g0212100 [Oryza sativa Japonica Group]